MDTAGGWEAFEAVTVRGTENLLEAAQRHQVKRFVHVSSLSVYEQLDQATLTEDAPFAQQAEGLGHYSRSKIEAERLVWHYAREYGLPITVLRPGKLYGLGQPPVIAPLRVPVGGKFQIVIASSKQRLPLTHVENAAEAISLALHCEQAVGRAYNIVDGETIQQGTYLTLLREVGLSQARTLLLPPAPLYPLVSLVAQMCRLIGMSPPLSRRQLERALASIRYDTTRAHTELGWRPTVKLVEALQTMRDAQGETSSA
jgi:nucleoside-diphosphate-sugar epimerase